jgi:hypothetical protein
MFPLVNGGKVQVFGELVHNSACEVFQIRIGICNIQIPDFMGQRKAPLGRENEGGGILEPSLACITKSIFPDHQKKEEKEKAGFPEKLIAIPSHKPPII